ncbi:MAG: hypothetical protein F6K09_25255 [Merismopedia sp. SIO2A8]|nr:hypothetical protein [Merismopedia sp. SIO2A8]
MEKRYPDLYVLASLTAYPFFLRNGYQKQQETGFWSEERIWIPCVMMQKSLFPIR